jgi:uncharacterized protein YjiS (DUF1127 family)
VEWRPDPTIRGNAANKWKSGQAEVKAPVEEPSWPLALLKAGIDTSTRTFAMFSIATGAHRRGRLARIGGRVVRLVRTLELALQVRHERRLLLAMDDRTLKDLGLHGIAYGEATRPFWDVGIDVSGGHYPLRSAPRKK